MMSPTKKVSFIEKIDKSVLGLKGLQVVVYSDRSREIDADKEEIKDEKYNFNTIGKKLLKEIDGDYIINKYNLKPGIELGKKLHEERVKYLKENI